MTDVDLQFVDESVERIGRGPEAVIPLLQAVQTRCGYLPREALRRICALTEITPADVEGVSSFYGQFRHRPVGKHIIRVCHGTACHVKGAPLVTDALLRYLGIEGEGEDTDADGLFTVDKVACLGCCTLAPVVQIGDVTYGHTKPDTVGRMLDDFLAIQVQQGSARKREPEIGRPAPAGEVRIGLDSCCIARGTGRVQEALTQTLERMGIDTDVRVKRVGCVGMCSATPLVEVLVPGKPAHLYAQVQPEDAPAVLMRHFKPRGLMRRVGRFVSRALEKVLTDESWQPITRYAIDVRDRPVREFFGRQRQIAIEQCGQIDPLDIDEYLSHEGFVTLRRALEKMTPARIVEEVTRSGLRGRGGAGYPTGLKWSHVRASGRRPLLICNCDEGDPGAFMDRMLLESFPYRIIEGIAIAARAIGARQGYFYIRAEYPLALRRMRRALDICRERGFLGPEALGSGAPLELEIMEGAGAFVCGEETAMIASIEGRRGMPRIRPPYPAVQGLWGRPTLVNNVETYSLVPWIIRNGPEAFAQMGTEHSKGTKVFALAGKVARGGLIEVPMGVTIRQIVEEIGGGVAEGRRFKAVQVGGPSGGCIPAEMGDMPVDYEALSEAGAMMGSGGLVVLDETDCIVDIARYFLQFTQDQSCGRCTFCRVGTRRMLDILERLCAGKGASGDLEQLEQLAMQVKRGSLCGLGKTAPNPVLSTLRYFRQEYEAHLEGRCPAGVCKELITYRITDDCIGCTRCSQHCPADAIEPKPYETQEIDTEKCIRCGTCRGVCPVDAVIVE